MNDMVLKRRDPIMKSMLTLIVPVMFLSSAAFAQIDSGPDGLGVYFDEAATQVAVVPEDPGDMVQAYLVLVDPTHDGQLSSWRAHVRSGFDEGCIMVGTPRIGQDMEMDMPGSNYCGFEVIVDPGTPNPTQPVMVLADLTIYDLTEGAVINVYLGWPATASYEVDGHAPQPFQPSSGSFDLPVARINGEPPVATRDLSWGRVKALFE